MNPLDIVIAVGAVMALVGGWRMGFLARAFGWAGAGFGLLVALAAVPRLIALLELESRGVIAVASIVTTLGLVTVGQGIGASIGNRVRPSSVDRGARAADSLAGAALGVLGVMVVVWLVAPLMLRSDGWTAGLARNSTVAGYINRTLPDPPPLLDELERRLRSGDFPELFKDFRPAPDVGPPPDGSAIGADQLAVLSRSIVRIEGPACDSIQTGSGWAIGPGVVATNAHVVAGTESLEVETVDGRRGEATVVSFDPDTDLALLRTEVALDPLPTASGGSGDRGLVLGFPGGGPFDPSPFEISDVIDALGFDIYDDREVERRLVVLSSELAPGDSGSAVVREDGRVVAVAVAIAPDAPGVAYALPVEELADDLASSSGEAVSTGDCLA
ncbi:MAG: MarP family serine protease [Actinomycetota bacterium]